MKAILSIIFLYGFMVPLPDHFMHPTAPSSIEKNEMHVSWEYHQDRIHFTMEAPTTGWITIGFNEQQQLPGSYLLMGRIHQGKPEVVEHHTFSLGDYRALSTVNQTNVVTDVTGTEQAGNTRISFSVPVLALDHYRKDLSKDGEWTLWMAYSRHDDFQHHSIMRTSTPIKL